MKFTAFFLFVFLVSLEAFASVRNFRELKESIQNIQNDNESYLRFNIAAEKKGIITEREFSSFLRARLESRDERNYSASVTSSNFSSNTLLKRLINKHYIYESKHFERFLVQIDQALLKKIIVHLSAAKVVNSSWDSTLSDYYFLIVGDKESIILQLGSFEGPSHLGI
jgi:hypothetical protein